MTKLLALALLLSVALAGCGGNTPKTRTATAPPVPSSGPSQEELKKQFPFRPKDLSGVDRVVVQHTISKKQVEWTQDDTKRLVRALSDSPATPTYGSLPACAGELELQLFAGTDKIADVKAAGCLIVIVGENATRHASENTEALLQSIAASLR